MDQARKVFESLKGKRWSSGEEEKPGLFKFVSMNDSGSFWRALRAAGIPAKTDPYNNLVTVGAATVKAGRWGIENPKDSLAREVLWLLKDASSLDSNIEKLRNKMQRAGQDEAYKHLSSIRNDGYLRLVTALRRAYKAITETRASTVAEIQQVLIKQGRPELAKSVATILAADMTPEIMLVKIPTTEKMDSGDLRLLSSMCLAALEKYRPSGYMEKAVHQKVVFKPF